MSGEEEEEEEKNLIQLIPLAQSLFSRPCSACRWTTTENEDQGRMKDREKRKLALARAKDQLLEEILRARYQRSAGGLVSDDVTTIKKSFQQIFKTLADEAKEIGIKPGRVLIRLGIVPHGRLTGRNAPEDEEMENLYQELVEVTYSPTGDRTLTETGAKKNVWRLVSHLAQEQVARDVGAVCGNVHQKNLVEVMFGLIAVFKSAKDIGKLAFIVLNRWNEYRTEWWKYSIDQVADYVLARGKPRAQRLALQLIRTRSASRPVDGALAFAQQLRQEMDRLLVDVYNNWVQDPLNDLLGKNLTEPEVRTFAHRVLELASLQAAEQVRNPKITGTTELPGPHTQDHGFALYPIRGNLPPERSSQKTGQKRLPAVVEPALFAYLGEEAGKNIGRKKKKNWCSDPLLVTNLETQAAELAELEQGTDLLQAGVSPKLLTHLRSLLEHKHTCPSETELRDIGREVFRWSFETCADWAKERTRLIHEVLDQMEEGGSGAHLPFIADPTRPS